LFCLANNFQVHWLKGAEGIERDAKLLEWLHLVLIPEMKPEVAREVEQLRRIVEEQLLIPMRVFGPLSKYAHHPVEFIWLCILIERPSELPIARRGLPICRVGDI
jgi:hypothetical protein